MTPHINFHLLRKFRETFEGKPYLHRNSTLGDVIAACLYDDLEMLGISNLLLARIRAGQRVVNQANKAVGKKARRGDGTFGEILPTATAIEVDGSLVRRGQVATIEIGAETKILAKAMIKQIDRVVGDLSRQVEEFKKAGGNPICVGIVGINHAEACTSYEGERQWPTDGSKHKHPIQEASEAESRLLSRARPCFNEFLILRFKATNTPPFPFEWVNLSATADEYSALLVRLSREYEKRFR
jgi:hypothetical protein